MRSSAIADAPCRPEIWSPGGTCCCDKGAEAPRRGLRGLAGDAEELAVVPRRTDDVAEQGDLPGNLEVPLANLEPSEAAAEQLVIDDVEAEPRVTGIEHPEGLAHRAVDGVVGGDRAARPGVQERIGDGVGLVACGGG